MSNSPEIGSRTRTRAIMEKKKYKKNFIAQRLRGGEDSPVCAVLCFEEMRICAVWIIGSEIAEWH